MNNRVDLTNIGQELIAQAFALTGTLHQTGDIHKLHPRGDQLFALAEVGELLEAVIGNRHCAHIRLNRAERKIGSLSLRIGHQGIEQGGFANVGQSDDSSFKHVVKSIHLPSAAFARTNRSKDTSQARKRN